MRPLYILLFLSFLALGGCFQYNENIKVVEKHPDGTPRRTMERLDKDRSQEALYYPNGKLERLSQFKGNQVWGESIRYREDGSKSALVTFYNGVRHGKTYEYYPSGVVSFEGDVVKGEFEGPSKRYYENSKVSDIWNRHLGKEIGWRHKFSIFNGEKLRSSFTDSLGNIKYYDGKGKQVTSEEWDVLGVDITVN